MIYNISIAKSRGPSSPTTEYAYQYDDIGNRITSFDLGTNCTYTANNLNQYTSISNFCGSLPSVALAEEGAANFTPQFDDDGNQTLIQTATGIWQIKYNGENRPVLWQCVTANSPTPNSPTPSLISMSYDRMGRRVTKNNQRFVYDGYLCIGKIEDSTSIHYSLSPIHCFVWDPTEPIATRPLVWTFQPFNSSTSYYTHDGNKNVSEVMASDGAIAAHYEYAPFGFVTVQRGESVMANPWRFSSEYAENDTRIVYYNYRHCVLQDGRWLTRDPSGGICEYSYVNNRYAIIDILGLLDIGKAWRRYKCYLLRGYLEEGSRFSSVDRLIFDAWIKGGGVIPLNAESFDPNAKQRTLLVKEIVQHVVDNVSTIKCNCNPTLNFNAQNSKGQISPTFSWGRLKVGDIMSYTIRGYGMFKYNCSGNGEKVCRDNKCDYISVIGKCHFEFQDEFQFMDKGSFFFGLINEKTVKDCAEEFDWGVGPVRSFAKDTMNIHKRIPCKLY